MRSLLSPIADRPGTAALALVILVVLGSAGDLAAPIAPVLPMLALSALALMVAAAVLIRRRPAALWPHGLMTFAGLLTLGFGTLALVQRLPGHERGVLAARFDGPAAIQDALLGPPTGSPQETAELRAALAQPDAPLRPRANSADEFLYNALLLRARDQPLPAAQALAEALRRAPDPRPDALLLHAGLMATDIAAVRQVLEPVPAGLAPAARAHLAAMQLPPGPRAAALAELLDEHPEALLAAAELARALVAASLPQGPTIATAQRITDALDMLDDPDRAEPFAARFLDPAGPARLGQELAEFGWVRDLATRRITAAALAPPPGMPNAPILIRITPPEPATGVQYIRGQDSQGDIWADVPQRTADTRDGARDPVPTLRLVRPHVPQEMRFRYLDRDGVLSEPVSWQFDPAQAIREAAQRALARQGPFALYQPGRIAPGRLNPLPIAGHFRAGLIAIEWHTDVERRPRNVPVGVPDEVILAGDVQRAIVEFAVPQGARSLFLAAVFADGSRSPLIEMAIR